MGMLFWDVTEDEEFIGKNENIILKSLLLGNCKKWSIYKHDKKYTEDLIIGIGHEVTQQIKTQKI
jgi:protein tyrosine phosphatase